jgi:hypothetical protein
MSRVKNWFGSQEFPAQFSTSVGVKAWYNKWEGLDTYVGKGGSDDSAFLIGPSVKTSYGRFFGGITYLVSMSDYEFEDVYEQGDTMDADREDLDLLVGCMIHPRFGVMAGYKQVESEGTWKGVDFKEDSELELSGFALGVTGNYPLTNYPLVLIASASYLPSMDYELTVTEPGVGKVHGADHDRDGFTFELGAAYTWRQNIGLSLGYKYQEIQKESGYDEDDMEFSGFIFGVDYRF